MYLPKSSVAIQITAVSTELTASYLACTTLAFVLYDWFISLDEEISVIWAFYKDRKLATAPLLYVLSRYSAIVQAILIWLTVFPMSHTACRINRCVQFVAGILVLFTPAVFSAARVYALSPNNKVAAISTLLLLFVPGFVIDIMNVFSNPTILPSPFNCTAHSPVSLIILARLTIALRIFTIAGDLLVLLVTWCKTYTSYKRVLKVHLIRRSIVHVMLYNGSTYFIIITAMNMVQLLSCMTVPSSLQNPAGFAISPLTPVLICRFLLDLRQADRASSTPSSHSGTLPVSLVFAPRSQGSNAQQHTAVSAFIMAMGSDIPTGMESLDSMHMGDGEDPMQVNGGDSSDNNLLVESDQSEIGGEHTR